MDCMVNTREKKATTMSVVIKISLMGKTTFLFVSILHTTIQKVGKRGLNNCSMSLHSYTTCSQYLTMGFI